jgi:hypothetical protein
MKLVCVDRQILIENIDYRFSGADLELEHGPWAHPGAYVRVIDTGADSVAWFRISPTSDYHSTACTARGVPQHTDPLACSAREYARHALTWDAASWELVPIDAPS